MLGVIPKEREISNLSAKRDVSHRAARKTKHHAAHISHSEAAGAIERYRGDNIVNLRNSNRTPSQLNGWRRIERASGGSIGFRAPQRKERGTGKYNGNTRAMSIVFEMHGAPH
jgi:hypothetical protein